MFKWIGKKIEKFTTIFHGGVVIEKESEGTNDTILNVNVNDALTTSATKSLIKVDYDKSGVAATGKTNNTIGLDVNLADTATNHSSSTIEMRGINIDIDSASNQGYIWQRGILINVASDGVGDPTTARGIEMTVLDGGYDIMMRSSAGGSDNCIIATTTNGATTITTNDHDAALAHFEIAADGDITLDAAGDIKLEPASGSKIYLDDVIALDSGVITGATEINSDNFKGAGLALESAAANNPIISLLNTTNDATGPVCNFASYRWTGAYQDMADADVLGTIRFRGFDDGTPSIHIYSEIIADIHDATAATVSGRLTFKVQAHAGGLESGLIITGGSQDDEVNVTVGLGAESTTTILGTLTMGSTAAMTNAGLLSVANQSNITGVGTIGTGVWNGDKITDIYTNSSGKRFGSTIKILPNDFMGNEDTAGSAIHFRDPSANTGVVPGNSSTELWAFVAIPQGMTATSVVVYSNNSARDVFVYEMDINSAGLGSSLGDNTLNSAITIDVDSTATNFLAIMVDVSHVSNQRLWGGLITIAAQ